MVQKVTATTATRKWAAVTMKAQKRSTRWSQYRLSCGGGKRATKIKVMDTVVRGCCDNLGEVQVSLKLIFTRIQVFHRKEILFTCSKATFDAAITSDS